MYEKVKIVTKQNTNQLIVYSIVDSIWDSFELCSKRLCSCMYYIMHYRIICRSKRASFYTACTV